MKNSKIDKLVKQIKSASDAYYNGEEIISDDEFDALVYELEQLDPKNEFFKTVGAPATSEWKKVKHLTPMGSLDKVNLPEEMSEWINSKLQGRAVLVIEKLDGISIGIQYEDGKVKYAVTRGSGVEGDEIISNVKKMKGFVPTLKSKFTGSIRGEIMLTKSDHKKYFSDKANPRNAASGISRRFDGAGSEHLTVMMYDVSGDEEFETEEQKLTFLKKNGFIVPAYQLCKTDKEVNNLWQQYQDSIRDSLDWEIDGLVAYCNDLSFQHSLGERDMRPKGRKGFKFANQMIKTKIEKIEWLVGNSGRVTPRCWFTPVSLLGSTVEKASVYNIAYIDKLKIGVGAEVLICKANEIIPRVEKVVKPSSTVEKIPTRCPDCDSTLKMIGENLQCLNSEKCFGQITGRVENWIAELNILEIGKGLIDKLVKSGKVTTVADLYKLSREDFAAMERMGERSAENVYKSLWAKQEIPLEQFIGGLSIPLIGSSTIKLLIENGYDTLPVIQKLTAAQMENVDGIGPTKAQSLWAGLRSYQSVIDQLLSSGLKIKTRVVGSLSGKTFCITGSTKLKRAVLEEMIVNAGGVAKSSVSKPCSHLIIADPNSTSIKAVGARKMGIKLISEEEFLEMIK